MTQHKTFKRLVRERQARTGESYMVAMRQIRDADDRQPIPVEELIDLSEPAAALGLTCRVVIQQALAACVDVGDVLRRLRSALRNTVVDPAFDLMRAVVLHGESSRAPNALIDRAFLARVKAGLGGVSSDGRVLALPLADGALGLFYLWTVPAPFETRPATLIISRPGTLLVELPLLQLALRGLL